MRLFAALILSLLWNATALSAVRVNAQHLSFQALTQTFSIQTQTKLATKVSKPNQLRLINQHQSPNHQKHLRFEQSYQGVPILGAEVIVHAPAAPQQSLGINTHSVRLTGELFQSLDKDLPTKPDFDLIAQEKLKSFKAPYLDKQIQQVHLSPVIYIDKTNQAHWAFEVKLLITPPNAAPFSPSAILDALTGAVYVEWNDLKTRSAQIRGLGYGGNPAMGFYQYGEGREALSIQAATDTGLCSMENDHARVIDMSKASHYHYTSTLSFQCTPMSQNNTLEAWTGYSQDGYDKINEAASPSNDALWAASIIYKLYQDWYTLPPLINHSGKPAKLIMRVHYGQAYANAFWDGKQMTFGDGDETEFYPMVSLGISAHEISHGFTEQHARLVYFAESGAINEAFSDMAAKAAEYYAGLPESWKIGEELLKPANPLSALRYMDKPSQDNESVDSLQAYNDANQASYDTYGEGLDVHYGSGVFNRLFYLLATTKGWDIHRAFDVMVYANLDYWTSLTDFQHAGCGMRSAAKDLGYEVTAVDTALKGVGLAPERC